MKLCNKIRDRKIAYFFRKAPEIAFELALLFFVMAKRKKANIKIIEACRGSVYWFSKASVELPEHIHELSAGGQMEELEKILVKNKGMIESRVDLVLLFAETVV